MADLKTRDALALADQCRRESESDMSMRLMDWQMYAEFDRGNQNIYQSKELRQVIKLYRGAYIPEEGQYFAEDYMPTLNHLGVISDSITARANANPLKPLVRPKTGEDDDRDAAKASTLALQSYDQTLDADKDRREAVEWLKITGNCFAKDWWDRNLGDILPPLQDGADTVGLDVRHLMNSAVEPTLTGDLNGCIIPPHAMIIPPGASRMKDLDYIGDMSAISVTEAKGKYGVDVTPEEGLQDLRQLQAVDTTAHEGNGILKDSVRVIDLYFPPSQDHPTPEQKRYGRHIITVGGKLVEDGVWDRALTERPEFGGVWHPYSKCEFIRTGGDFWGGTPYKDLCQDQIEINRQWRMAAGSKQIIRTILAYQDNGTVDVDKLRLTKHGQGLARLPYDGNTPPALLNIPGNDDGYINRIEHLKRNMDDRLATYQVTRGNVDPSVTSGKQQQALVQAATIQASPLSLNLAMFFRDRWRLRLQLLAVHLTAEKVLRIVGAENEAISFTLKPEHLTSDDVVVEDLQAFLTDPETRKQQIRQNFGAMLYGDPRDPVVRQKVARMLDVPFSEELDETARDIERAKWENRAFMRGEFDEKNPAIIQRIMAQHAEAVQAFQQAMLQYQQDAQAYPQAVAIAAASGAPPPPESAPPTPPPAQPIMWKRPRPWEDHRTHIETHNAERKTAEYEKKCQENPLLFDVMEFHVKEHEKMAAEGMMRQAQQMQAANPASSPLAREGDSSPSPPSRPGPGQPGPQSQGVA